MEANGELVPDWSTLAGDILTGDCPKVVLVATQTNQADSQAAEDTNAVQRVLSARNEFEVLGLPLVTATETAVRKAYRKVSLHVHPDKIEDPKAPEAFRRVLSFTLINL